VFDKLKNVFIKKNYKSIKIKFNRGDRVLLNWNIWIYGKLKKGTVLYAETSCFGVRYGVKLDNDDRIYSFGGDMLIKLDKSDNIEDIEPLHVKTGVFSLNKVAGIWDEIFYGDNVIDLSTEELEEQFYENVRKKYNSEHDECLPDDYDFDLDELELVDYQEKDEYIDICDYHVYYIGYMKDPENPEYYIEDPDAEYSAYIGEEYGFVTRSKYICKAAPGSPCIPHQVDLESEGNEWAFTLPEDIWDSDKPEWMEIIKTDKKTVNLTAVLLR